ncbi:MAG: hypothetical protein WHU10_03340 [Fimbriimonadales bacterium]
MRLETGTAFRWQGFEVCLPEDWAPVSLIGDRREGYCRFGSPGSVGFQVRWKAAKHPGRLRDPLFAYFRILQKEARRAGKSFESELEEADGRIRYRWRAHSKAQGEIFHSSVCGRLFFLELLGDRKDSLGLYRRIASSFRSQDPAGPDRWCVLGLTVRFPKTVRLESRLFQAGRTVLEFSARGFRAHASRWGFGSQLAERHGLAGWAAGAFRVPQSELVEIAPHRLQWDGANRFGARTRLLVRLDEEQNRILALKASYRNTRWRPEWDWLES